MGFDTRPSNGLAQTQSTYNTSTFPQLPQSPSSLPDTSNQQSNSNQASAPAWSTQSVQYLSQNGGSAVPAEQRQNPRRSSAGISKPPTLVRQDERKVSFVDGLVDSATQMVEVIWPLSVAPPQCHSSASGVLSLRKYIEETLRRSRTSYSTLQVALYYLILIMPHVPKCDFTKEQLSDSSSMRALQCGRRMFLAALILASKYLQDRNYSAKAWSKMSGLKATEINMNERAFLQCVNWKLHIPDHIFKRWTDVVLLFTPSQFPPPPGHAISVAGAKNSWKEVIPLLTPELDMVRFRASRAVASAESVASSQQTTVASLPSYLEPVLEVIPPTPAFAGTVASLPTPRSTPPRSYTPAVSVASAESWPLLGRRSSTSPTGSTGSRDSSPDSVCSEASRLSRSSSISSVSTAATSVSSQSSVSAQACLSKLVNLRSSQTLSQMVHESAVTSAPVQQRILVNDDLVSSPMPIVYSEDKPLPVDDAPSARASRAAKRSFSQLSDEEEQEEYDVQSSVRTALRERQSGSMPVILEDKVQVRSGSQEMQRQVQAMVALRNHAGQRRKRVCVSAH